MVPQGLQQMNISNGSKLPHTSHDWHPQSEQEILLNQVVLSKPISETETSVNDDEYLEDPNYQSVEDEIDERLFNSDCFINVPTARKRKMEASDSSNE